MTEQPISMWLVPLEGLAFDLEDLPICMLGHAVQAVLHEGNYHLALPVSVAGTSAERILKVASEFIDLVNGAASLLIAQFKSIMVSQQPLFGVDSASAVVSVVMRYGVAEERNKAGQHPPLVADPLLLLIWPCE